VTGFDLYPAIDLRGGRCVRLYQGDYAQETVYEDDPPAQARRFAAAGAHWLHVVDLDAARTGDPLNRPAVAAIAAAVGVPVQVGGGVRTVEAAEALFAAGVARVVVGTAAVENPALVSELAARRPVAVGLDVRDRRVAVRGWKADAGIDMRAAVDRFANVPLAAFVVTQIAVDGTLGGPDLDLYSTLMLQSDVPVVASGGVGRLADLVALRDLAVDGRRLAGAIVGRALYEGAFGLPDALAVAAGGAVDPPPGAGRAPGRAGNPGCD
jgi:phosphoribosylformimino-5-aminoimidazole carboxamide ribotide isomerase